VRDAQPAAGKLLPLRLVQHAAVREPAVVLVPADAPVEWSKSSFLLMGVHCCCAARRAEHDSNSAWTTCCGQEQLFLCWRALPCQARPATRCCCKQLCRWNASISLEVLAGAAAVGLQREVDVLLVLRQVGVQPHPGVLARQLRCCDLCGDTTQRCHQLHKTAALLPTRRP
jgi:hypothetical protein